MCSRAQLSIVTPCPFVKTIKAEVSLIKEQMLEYHLETALQFHGGVLLANTAAHHQGATKTFYLHPRPHHLELVGFALYVFLCMTIFPLCGISSCVLMTVYLISMWICTCSLEYTICTVLFY